MNKTFSSLLLLFPITVQDYTFQLFCSFPQRICPVLCDTGYSSLTITTVLIYTKYHSAFKTTTTRFKLPKAYATWYRFLSSRNHQIVHMLLYRCFLEIYSPRVLTCIIKNHTSINKNCNAFLFLWKLRDWHSRSQLSIFVSVQEIGIWGKSTYQVEGQDQAFIVLNATCDFFMWNRAFLSCLVTLVTLSF